MDGFVHNYLANITQQFEYYKALGEKTMGQLSDEQLFWMYNADSNSIAIIVNHLSGNMMSRFTDFLTSDGEKPWRKRDSEFEHTIRNRRELEDKWSAGWSCLFNALSGINETNITTTVYIRNQAHTITEALNRQLAHYASHVGQMVYLGKMLQGEQWKSLSIPRGKSSEFNESKFSKGKHGGHFSEDII